MRAKGGLTGLMAGPLTVIGTRDGAQKPIVNFERDARSPMLQNLTAIRRAIEAAGLTLIGENGGGRGVRFAAPGAEDAVPLEAGGAETGDAE